MGADPPLDDGAAALRAKDADRLLAHRAPGRTVHFTLAPPLKDDGDKVMGKKNLERWFATRAGSLDYEIRSSPAAMWPSATAPAV